MTPSDYQSFCQAMKLVSHGFPTWNVCGDDLDAWFQLLSEFDLQSVKLGLKAVVMDGSRGSFPPTIPEVVAKIVGERQNVSRPHVLNQLENPTTPLGVFARIYISSFDRAEGGFRKKEAVDMFIERIPEFERRVAKKGYKQSELVAFKKYGVNPGEQFARAQRTPQTIAIIRQQVDKLKSSKAIEHQNKNHTDDQNDKRAASSPEVKKYINEILEGLK